MTVLQPFVMSRLDICRQRTTSLLAITPEKDTHAQNRERVPLIDFFIYLLVCFCC